MTTKELLIAARDLIASPEAWTQGTYARNALGESTPLQGADAVCWCASGAILKILEKGRDEEDFLRFRDSEESCSLWDEAMRVMNESLEIHGRMTVPTWNDMDGRTHGEVLAMFDAAIEDAS